MEIFDFTDIFIDVTSKARKIPKARYLECGKYPIIDQGKNQVAGYCDDIAGIFNEVPVIVFGDHTLVLKYIDKPLFIGADGVKLLKCKFEHVNYKYLYYSLCSLKIENTGYNRHFKYLKEKKIYLPSLESQEKIARNLELANELVKLHKTRSEELDKLIQSVFYDMFGDPVTNEKGWEVMKLSKILSVIGGYAFKSGDFKENGIPVLKIGNINSGAFKDTNLVFWENDITLDRYAIYPNDLVISLTGTVGKDDYGNVCILDSTYQKYFLNQRNAKLEITGALEKYYLMYLLKDKKVKSALTGVNRGVRQANISNSDILKLIVPIPPLSIQQKFAAVVTEIENQKIQVQKALDDAQMLYESLMQKYFR